MITPPTQQQLFVEDQLPPPLDMVNVALERELHKPTAEQSVGYLFC